MLQFVSALHETKQVLLMFAIAVAGCAPKQPPPPKEPQWVAAQPTTPTPVASAPIDGKALYETKGCASCHSIDGSAKIGPTFKGAWGTTVSLVDGTTVAFDEAYAKESILRGQAKMHVGFPPSHPSFEGQLSDDEVTALVGFIKAQT